MRITKIILLLFTFIFPFFIVNNTNASFTDERFFIVTAYYSPVPGQKHYTTGSYWGDVRLNGEGHTTASGKPVETGLLAAPKNYPFGTKIYFEGYGIGTVEDRGGAIVEAGVEGHEYDRIDIWMGYGDEGLMRAKKWGKRTIKGQIVDSSSEITLEFGDDILSGYEDIKVNPENKDPVEVKRLQELFTKLGLYDGMLDGKFSSIEDELIQFQVENKAISSIYDEAAGYFGPKTFVALLKKFGTAPLIKEEKKAELIAISEKVKTILEFGDIELDGDNPEQEEVKKIQNLFKKLELYNGEIDGIYENIKNDLISFQIKVGLAQNESSWGAGHFGDKTKEALLKYFEEENREAILRRKIEEDKLKYNLALRDLEQLMIVSQKLETYIKVKSRGSEEKEEELTNSIRQQIDDLSLKVNNSKSKSKLKYLSDKLNI